MVAPKLSPCLTASHNTVLVRGGGLVRTISISKLIHSPPLGQSEIFLEL